MSGDNGAYFDDDEVNLFTYKFRITYIYVLIYLNNSRLKLLFCVGYLNGN